MTLQDRQQAIAAAKAEMERQKAREQALLDQIIEAVAEHYGFTAEQIKGCGSGGGRCGRRRHSWERAIVANIATRLGFTNRSIAIALKIAHTNVPYYEQSKIMEARRAIKILDAVMDGVVNKPSTR